MTVILPECQYVQSGRPTISPKELLNQIKNTTCSLPEPSVLLQDYVTDEHTDLEALRKDVNKYLEWLSSSSIMAKKITRADLARMAAAITPYTTYERARTIAYLIAWGFVWDDQVDVGPFRDSVQLGEQFRKQTLQFVKKSLGLAGRHDLVPVLSPEDNDADRVIFGFAVIGKAISAQYSIAQCKRLYRELVFWIRSTRDEQVYYEQKIIPSSEQYWTLRMALSGYGVTLTMIEYAWGTELPSRVMNSHGVRQLMAATIAVMWLENDICSLKKELADDQFSMPSGLVLERNISMQAALDHCITWIKAALEHFDQHARCLEVEFHDNVALLTDVKKFVKGCEYQMTGNARWSWTSARYGVPEASNGTVKLTF